MRSQVTPPRILWPFRRRLRKLPRLVILWLCRRLIFESPRISFTSATLVLCGPGFPGSSRPRASPLMPVSGFPSSCISGFCRRWSFELPRSSHPSAVPTGRPWSCPRFRSFGIADDRLGGSPRFADLPAPSGGRPGSPGCRTFRILPLARFTGLPRLLVPLARRRANFQVALKLRSLGVASDRIGELPRFSSLWRCRRWLPGVPGPHLRLVDDESPAVRELCILGARRG